MCRTVAGAADLGDVAASGALGGEFLAGRLGEAEDVSVRLVRSLSVSLGRRERRVKVALDGEITRMRTPLEFSIAKRALRLRAPHPATSEDDPG